MENLTLSRQAWESHQSKGESVRDSGVGARRGVRLGRQSWKPGTCPPFPSEEATSPLWGLGAFESMFFSHPQTMCEKMKSADSKTSPFPSIVAKRTSKNTCPFHISSVKITA